MIFDFEHVRLGIIVTIRNKRTERELIDALLNRWTRTEDTETLAKVKVEMFIQEPTVEKLRYNLFVSERVAKRIMSEHHGSFRVQGEHAGALCDFMLYEAFRE